jgi:hypothetical protein
MSSDGEGVVLAVVTLALPSPEGLIVVDSVIEGEDARGTRITFRDLAPDIRDRLDDFGRRGLLLDERLEDRVA